ncbi:MAG: ATP-dependent zinc metalloprotease FtsH [Clostridia bacterium]|nr:ATP-dependent zinc metalloprotease FtsH [Clostridia bacterium]
MKSSFKNILIFVLLIVTVIVFAMILSDMRKDKDKVSYGEVLSYFDDKLVSSAEYDTDSYLTLYLRVPGDWDGNGERDLDENGVPVTKTDAKGSPIYQKVVYRLASYVQLEKVNELCEDGLENGWLESYDFEEPTDTPWYISFLPYIIVIVLFIVFYVVMVNRAGQGVKNGFARSHAKVSYNDKNAVKFTDVAGADEEKKELEEVVEFLRDPGKFIKLGARIPRGILLVGPPGTGKTLLAKAVAGEAGVPFYSISGSDFVEMYVGVGASRVRDLFDSARKHPASIIFIDEIDAVGRHRGAGLGGGHDEREQTLNQLLVEMDGFGNHEGVIVMAATNRPDILDPALLRPGRFDRQVTVNYPDLKGREEILKVHVRNKPLEANVDLHRIAQTTVGFTGADLANLMNEAALLAAGRGKTLIGMQEIEQATLKVLVGAEKKGKIITEDDKKMTAYHEAGHAIVCHLLPSQDPVTRISIIPTSKGAGGYTLMPPVKDVAYEFKREMEDSIAVSLAGRVAEQLIFNDYSGGASSDIKQATQLARKMVTVYGMSEELGTVCLAGEHTGDEVFLGRDFSSGENLSEETVAKIDREIRRIVSEGKERATQILQSNMEKLHAVADFLMKYEVMDGAQFNALMDENATEDDLVEMNKQKEEQSKRENSVAAEEREKREREEAERIRREQEQFWNDPLEGFKDDGNDGNRR